MDSYWWGPEKNGQKGCCWSTWEKLCLRKEEGGLGFRRLHDYNIAMVAKQAWRMLSKLDSLATS